MQLIPVGDNGTVGYEGWREGEARSTGKNLVTLVWLFPPFLHLTLLLLLLFITFVFTTEGENRCVCVDQKWS